MGGPVILKLQESAGQLEGHRPASSAIEVNAAGQWDLRSSKAVNSNVDLTFLQKKVTRPRRIETGVPGKYRKLI
ncbi:hypothetical protein TNCT_343171 [Trichonephila clavata]|uniref:Uncharacterized protein n=1 Tax=Trichonephila clavata TaxID=2740835 RepID=A0A8X6F2H4_TRICU|nr:hypothetical protein TNCT_343171 [Trichonephila clavata]